MGGEQGPHQRPTGQQILSAAGSTAPEGVLYKRKTESDLHFKKITLNTNNLSTITQSTLLGNVEDTKKLAQNSICKVWPWSPRGVPNPVLGVPEVRTIFIILRLCFLHCVDISDDGARANGESSGWALTQITFNTESDVRIHLSFI